MLIKYLYTHTWFTTGCETTKVININKQYSILEKGKACGTSMYEHEYLKQERQLTAKGSHLVSTRDRNRDKTFFEFHDGKTGTQLRRFHFITPTYSTIPYSFYMYVSHLFPYTGTLYIQWYL